MLPSILVKFLEHIKETINAHVCSNTSQPDSLIKSDNSGKLSNTWFSPIKIEADKFKSYGSSKTNTGYTLANGADISTLFKDISGQQTTITGSKDFITDITMTLENGTLKTNIQKNHCVYCTHCTYCTGTVSHCTYCTYCSNCSNCHCNC